MKRATTRQRYVASSDGMHHFVWDQLLGEVKQRFGSSAESAEEAERLAKKLSKEDAAKHKPQPVEVSVSRLKVDKEGYLPNGSYRGALSGKKLFEFQWYKEFPEYEMVGLGHHYVQVTAPGEGALKLQSVEIRAASMAEAKTLFKRDMAIVSGRKIRWTKG